MACIAMLLFPLGVSAAPFDVTAYGAVGDGVTDDTKAVAKALLAAGKHHPSVVLFPGDKTFLTGTSIVKLKWWRSFVESPNQWPVGAGCKLPSGVLCSPDVHSILNDVTCVKAQST